MSEWVGRRVMYAGDMAPTATIPLERGMEGEVVEEHGEAVLVDFDSPQLARRLAMPKWAAKEVAARA